MFKTISGTSQSFHLVSCLVFYSLFASKRHFKKANNEVDRENWLVSLEYARHRAIKRADSVEEEVSAVNNGSDFESLISEVKTVLNKKLDDLRATELQISKPVCLNTIRVLVCSEADGRVIEDYKGRR